MCWLARVGPWRSHVGESSGAPPLTIYVLGVTGPKNGSLEHLVVY